MKLLESDVGKQNSLEIFHTISLLVRPENLLVFIGCGFTQLGLHYLIIVSVP